MTYTETFIPSPASALYAAMLLQSIESEAPETGDLIIGADREVLHALAGFAHFAIRGLARLGDDTYEGVLQQLRLHITDTFAVLAKEGEIE